MAGYFQKCHQSSTEDLSEATPMSRTCRFGYGYNSRLWIKILHNVMEIHPSILWELMVGSKQGDDQPSQGNVIIISTLNVQVYIIDDFRTL